MRTALLLTQPGLVGIWLGSQVSRSSTYHCPRTRTVCLQVLQPDPALPPKAVGRLRRVEGMMDTSLMMQPAGNQVGVGGGGGGSYPAWCVCVVGGTWGRE